MKKSLLLICILLFCFTVVGCETEDNGASELTENGVTTPDEGASYDSEGNDANEVEGSADNSLSDGLFAVRSGIIEYKLSGTEEGTSITYFDDYGKKSAEHKDSTGAGGAQSTRSISFDGDIYVYHTDNPAQGAKMVNPMIDILNEMDEPDYDKVIESFYSDLGFERTGTENFMGKECILYESDTSKILTWKGILMLMDMKVAGTTTRREVTSIETDIPVDDSYFELPAGTTFIDMPAF